MDQSRYKTSACFNSHVLSSFGDSWEEQAFAEDAAGPLGGCIWPPRSYTCSFCRREFRSAQALGGHMNVHRRDRARLKQTPNSNQILDQLPNNTSTLGSSGRCMLQSNPNRDEIYNPNFDAVFSTSSSSPSPNSILRPFTCSFVQEQQKRSATTPILSWSTKFEPRKRFHVADNMGNLQQQEKKGNYAKVIELNTSIDDHQIEIHLAGTCDTPVICNEKKERGDGLIFKRRRIDHDLHEEDAQSLFLKTSNLIKGDEAKSMVSFKGSPSSTLENLDLELRLGDRL